MATGALSLARSYLKASLAACPTFRTLVGAATVEAALLKIYDNGLPKPANGLRHTLAELVGYRPFAVVFTRRAEGLVAHSVGMSQDGADFDYEGVVCAHLERKPTDDTGDSPTAVANTEWEDTLGSIIDELCGLAGQAGYLDFHTLILQRGPEWNSRDEIQTIGLYQSAVLSFEWGGPEA